MTKIIKKFVQTYFGPELDLRVRLFNVLALGGGLTSFIIGVVYLFTGRSFVLFAVDMLGAAGAFALIAFAARTGRYRVCYFITIVTIFLGLFPYVFLRMGGYHGGFTTFFIFAVVFTVFMLNGKTALIVSAIELAVYVGLFIYSYINPDIVTTLPDEKSYLVSNTLDLVVVCIALGVTMYAQIRLYRSQQDKLNEQNEMLAESSRSKTEFFANASHEMRTPLTVISVNVQTVTDILDELSLKDEEAGELLKSAQSEIMRLARMVGGMLTLASMSETVDRQETDLTSLLQSGVEMLRLNLSKRGNKIETQIEKGLSVFGNADLLVQVLINLLQNAGAHMENGTVTVSAAKDGDKITVTVRDTGKGITPALLPHVFERGVTTGGTGFGLHLCKTVIESHGGKIWIESEQGTGTTVFYTLPVYAGQFGSDKR